MASASCRETAIRLLPRVAHPRPSAVTSTEVRPILRFSKEGIALSCCHSQRFVRAEYTPFVPSSGGGGPSPFCAMIHGWAALISHSHGAGPPRGRVSPYEEMRIGNTHPTVGGAQRS